MSFEINKLSLNYWNGRGLMEVPRMMLAYSGHFPDNKVFRDFTQKYQDNRYTTDSENVSENCYNYQDIINSLPANLGRLPVISYNDNFTLGQSTAINFYLANKLNLMGDSLEESAKIIEFTEHLKEMMQSWRNLCPYGTEPNDEIWETWFTKGADDQSPQPANMKTRSTRYFRWWANRLEYLAGVNYSIGNRFSLADFMIFNIFGEYLPSEQSNNLPEWRRSSFGNFLKTIDALAEYPKLRQICENVGENKNIQHWLENRGQQKF